MPRWKDTDEKASVRTDLRDGRIVLIAQYDGSDVCWTCGNPLADEPVALKWIGEREIVLHQSCTFSRGFRSMLRKFRVR